MPQATEDIKSRARRIWEEIIPSGDAAALPDVMHPDCADHSARPGEPPGHGHGHGNGGGNNGGGNGD